MSYRFTPAIVAALRKQERALVVDPTGRRWRLTWLQ